jgi:hypothetical protein
VRWNDVGIDTGDDTVKTSKSMEAMLRARVLLGRCERVVTRPQAELA